MQVFHRGTNNGICVASFKKDQSSPFIESHDYLHELWYNGAAGGTVIEPPLLGIWNTKNKNGWSQPCFPFALFERITLLNAREWILSQKILISTDHLCGFERNCGHAEAHVRRLHVSHHFWDEIIWGLARSIKNPTLHASMFLWNDTRGGKLPVWHPC